MTALSCLKGRDVKVWAATEAISESGCHLTARETWPIGLAGQFLRWVRGGTPDWFCEPGLAEGWVALTIRRRCQRAIQQRSTVVAPAEKERTRSSSLMAASSRPSSQYASVWAIPTGLIHSGSPSRSADSIASSRYGQNPVHVGEPSLSPCYTVA
jgi:hypothetical protein